MAVEDNGSSEGVIGFQDLSMENHACSSCVPRIQAFICYAHSIMIM